MRGHEHDHVRWWRDGARGDTARSVEASNERRERGTARLSAIRLDRAGFLRSTAIPAGSRQRVGSPVYNLSTSRVSRAKTWPQSRKNQPSSLTKGRSWEVVIDIFLSLMCTAEGPSTASGPTYQNYIRRFCKTLKFEICFDTLAGRIIGRFDNDDNKES